MNEHVTSPAFGQADLTNCERELIHLAGSIQPHGILLVLDADARIILQASTNAMALPGVRTANLVGGALADLGGNIDAHVHAVIADRDVSVPQPVRCLVGNTETLQLAAFEGLVHRHAGGGIVVELEPVRAIDDVTDTSVASDSFESRLSRMVERISESPSIATLSDTVVNILRDMTGYDRVMVYKFDPDGHGKIIGEARDAALEPLLGHHYPATDIPQRARELYLRTRVRVLVDVNYEPVPIVPDGHALDMSLCHLRSMSPLHLQYLKNMGVTATLVVSLVREGKLWGLIACHHYSPKHVGYGVRAACGLLAEAISTRIAAIENFAHSQGVILVRSLEQRLIEATQADGDWRRALVGNTRTLLQPVNATGAVLFFEGEILCVGEVPSTPELRQLLAWIATRVTDSIFSCSSVARENPALASITPTASGVLAIELSSSRPDLLVWLRREQLSEVTWAGDPSKAVIDNDPLNLSPRRSFASWLQIVRDTASPWSGADIALAREIGATLVDIILQIQAVRLLIAEHQLSLVRVTVENSKEPVIIADSHGRILFANKSFSQQAGMGDRPLSTLNDLASIFTDKEQALLMLRRLVQQRQSWRGELSFAAAPAPIPVGVRADNVPGANGGILGFILIFTNLSDAKKAEAARQHMESALQRAGRGIADADTTPASVPDQVVNSILANARLAALDIVDGGSGRALAPLIEELETATKQAMAIYLQLRSYHNDRD